jgi:hypothetical protein
MWSLYVLAALAATVVGDEVASRFARDGRLLTGSDLGGDEVADHSRSNLV